MKRVKFALIALMSLILIHGCKEANEIRTKDDNVSDNKMKTNVKEIPMPYAVAKYDCPVLNTSDFSGVYGGSSGSTLKKSKNGLVKPLEFVAYAGTTFEITDSSKDKMSTIYKVRTEEYPIILEGTDLFVDARFVELRSSKPEPAKKTCPPRNYIYDYFEKSGSSFYVWGGNNISGVEKMLDFYPPKKKLQSREDSLIWKIEGVDCSGILYEATKAYTPRNTHQLVEFGEPVEIKSLSSEEIISRIKPLDLIVWKGHIIIVYDNKTTIESSHSAGGVVRKSLNSVLKNIMKSRVPVNKWNDSIPKSFVIRRWFKE